MQKKIKSDSFLTIWDKADKIISHAYQTGILPFLKSKCAELYEKINEAESLINKTWGTDDLQKFEEAIKEWQKLWLIACKKYSATMKKPISISEEPKKQNIFEIIRGIQDES